MSRMWGEWLDLNSKGPINYKWLSSEKHFGILKIQLSRYLVCMDRANFEALRASSAFERLSKETHDPLNRMMSTPEDVE